jgi:prepilin-type processing-associated H-X9-DG protein/prepilin-type N-terminal cleavage/methylation domain-containing protein
MSSALFILTNPLSVRTVDNGLFHPGKLLQKFKKFQICRALTLIELLVTVSIVALLAGLLAPSINKSIVRGKINQSLSNLRQVGMAFELYTADNDNVYPLVWDSNSTNSWLAITWPYVYPNKKFPGTQPSQLKGSIYYTPMVESGTTPRTWGMNAIMELVYTNRRYKTAISNFSEVSLAGDVKTSGSFRVDQANYRNNGKVHVLFFDGHVASLSTNDIPTSTSTIFWSAVNK